MNICGGDRSSQNRALPVYIESDASHPIASRGSRCGSQPFANEAKLRRLVLHIPRRGRCEAIHFFLVVLVLLQ
jgi:hypothetical protein